MDYKSTDENYFILLFFSLYIKKLKKSSAVIKIRKEVLK